MNTGSLLWTRWRALVRSHPHKGVLIDLAGRKEWTARAIQERLDSQTPEWSEHGRVTALALPNHPDWIIHFLSAQRAGAAVLPIDPRQPPIEQDALAAAAGATRIITTDGIRNVDPTNNPPPHGTVLIKTTSGTTGQPRRWPCHAGHLIADGSQVCRTMGIRASDRNLGLIPLGHSYAIGNLLMPLLLQGTTLALAAEFLPAQIPEWVRRHRLTVFPTVPSVLRVLARTTGLRGSPLRRVISAGAPLPPDTARAFHEATGLRPHNFYGASETGGIAYDRSGRAACSGLHVGRPLDGVRITITRQGRIRVTSLAVASRSGSHLLADRGMIDAQGRLRLLGREAAPANIGGRKVSPLEIEHVLQKLPGVREARVWIERKNDRDYLAAAVESDQSSSSLEQMLSARLSPWKMPRVWHVRTELPRNARGKLDRTALTAER